MQDALQHPAFRWRSFLPRSLYEVQDCANARAGNVTRQKRAQGRTSWIMILIGGISRLAS